MEIELRAIPHGSYVPAQVDAISCAYNMDGFTPMNAVLINYGIDRENFKSKALEKYHTDRGFLAISHGEIRPNVITTSEKWESISDAAFHILTTIESNFCKSLCMTHFAFVFGKFPAIAFGQFMQAVELAEHFNDLEKIVVDVDDAHLKQANAIWSDVRAALKTPLPANDVEQEYDVLTENFELEPVLSTAHQLERAETGDPRSMTELGQHYRNHAPILALKWLQLATVRGSKTAPLMMRHLKAKMSFEAQTAGARLSELWLVDQSKKIQTQRQHVMSEEFVAWLRDRWRPSASDATENSRS